LRGTPRILQDGRTAGRQGGRTANLQSEGGSISIPFEVSVAKESLGFSAAHFLALRGHVCERLHGHNYRIGARVAGNVDPATGFVVDFAVLKQALRDLADRMDHRVLVPTRNPTLRVREEGEQLFVDYHWPGWLALPRAHTCLLPVTHTTAELLAEYVAREVWNRLGDADGLDLERLELEVEESPGQGATYRIERRSIDD
jgi:6-pyruvoyltetrahydropterin/6-carboxytetrahydropterin synthase